jgi:hypothetical protein
MTTRGGGACIVVRFDGKQTKRLRHAVKKRCIQRPDPI